MFRFIFLIIACFQFFIWSPSSAAEKDRLVFAHYLVCCPTAGRAASIDDYIAEIKLAQSKGIDGFALNNGGWEKNEPDYKVRTRLIYEAARRLNSGFKLFISADGRALEELDDILNTVRNHPNQFMYRGAPVLSTYSAGRASGLEVSKLADRAKELGAFFVPYFFPRPIAREVPLLSDMKGISDTVSNLDGFFYFGAAGTGDQIANANLMAAKFWKSKGKIFMASVTPFYFGQERNFRIFETAGFEGMTAEWRAAIDANADWVQIVTWNDWRESTYVSPFPLKSPSDGRLPDERLLSHSAYLDASRYFIDWFKSGVEPAVTRDQLYYFYRLSPKSIPVAVSLDRDLGVGFPRGIEAVEDNVYVTVFLKQPATVIIKSGGSQKSFSVAAGMHNLSFPFSIGPQSFSVLRKGEVVIEKIGEKEISSREQIGRSNYFSGSAID